MSKEIKILIADDDPQILEGLEDILCEEYTVVKAKNGEIAIRLLHDTDDINLAILDIMMPKVDGYGVAKEITDKDLDIPYVFLSAKSQLNDIIEGFRLGADDYITKPFDEEELLLRVKRKLLNQEKINLRNKRLKLIHHNILTPTGVLQGYMGIFDDLIEKTDKMVRSNKISENSFMVSVKDWDHSIDQYKESMDEMKIAIGQLIELSKKFMETQVYKESEISIFKSKVNLKSFLLDTIALIKPKKLNVEIQEELPDIEIDIDRDRLVKVFYELFDNVELHNDNSVPKVVIKTEVKDNEVYFYFIDNGRGLKEEDFDKVFDEFWSGYEFKHHTRGEGVGLWLCKRYINLHGGSIWIEKSSIGEGTTLAFKIPVILEN